MSREFTARLLTLIIALLIAGCQEQAGDDPRFRVDPAMADIAQTRGFAVPGAAEADLVEQMAADRNSYRAGLKVLIRYYSETGDDLRREWAQQELEELAKVPQYRYLMAAELASPALRATDSIASADEIYNEAMKLYKDAGGLLIIKDDNKLRQALAKFNTLIRNFPTSDKIDDCAYYGGRIHEHFQDWEIAAVYYQRCFQWDKQTPYPARFRAARIMDRKLRMRDEALSLYRLAYTYEVKFPNNKELARLRILELTVPEKQEGVRNQQQDTQEDQEQSE